MIRWTLTQDEDSLVLARPGAVRLDVRAVSSFPSLRRATLAHEIRKDLWRCLRRLRGFSPVIIVERDDPGLRVIAGGRFDVPNWPKERTLTEIETLLADPAKRARWITHARRR